MKNGSNMLFPHLTVRMCCVPLEKIKTTLDQPSSATAKCNRAWDSVSSSFYNFLQLLLLKASNLFYFDRMNYFWLHFYINYCFRWFFYLKFVFTYIYYFTFNMHFITIYFLICIEIFSQTLTSIFFYCQNVVL